MMKMKSLLIGSLLKASAPFLVGASYNFFSSTPSKLNLTTNPQEISPDFFSRLNQLSFEIYSNFFAFMLAMLFLEVSLKIIQLGVKESWKEAKSSRISIDDENNSISSNQRRRVVYQMSENQMMRILSYTLIFASLQVAGICLSQASDYPLTVIENPQDLKAFSPLTMINSDQENSFGMPRILEEDQVSDNELVSPPIGPMESDKISLSMGTVLGSLNLNVNAMVLSKDRKIAYLTLDLYGTLKVVDISDLQSPFVIGSLNLEGSTYSYRVKNMLLSSDEKTLYASNSKDLEIIDVSDPSSPKRISWTKSEIFIEKTYGFNQNQLFMQESTKTLFIGGLGLQIYDVSDPKNPVLLKAVANYWKRALSPTRNEIRLSRDEQVLYMANGTFEVYNVSNPRDMTLLASFSTENCPRSLLLSEDEKTTFLIGSAPDYAPIIVFEEVDISDLNSISIQKTSKINEKSLDSPSFLAISPSKSKFFILTDSSDKDNSLIIFDRIKEKAIRNTKSLISEPLAMSFSPDSRNLITASNGQFMTIELFLDYPNSRIFSESLDNLISNFSLPTNCARMQISSDEKYLFTLRKEEGYALDSFLYFDIWDLKNTSIPLSTYTSTRHIQKIYVTKNYETAYLVGEKTIAALDIKNPASVNVKKTFYLLDSGQEISDFTTLSDENTGVLLASSKEKIMYLGFSGLSDSDSSIIDVSIKLEAEFKFTYKKLIVKDDKTLIIVLQGGFLIYDVSNLKSPTPLVSFPFGQNEPEFDVINPVLSPDGKTLYIETADKTEVHKLRVYDVSNSTAPQFVSEKDLSKRVRFYKRPAFSLSSDSKSGFISLDDSLLKLNVTDPKDIKFSGIIPTTKEFNNFLISRDGQTLYVSVGKEIRILNMNIKYSLFLKQEKFRLGEKYSGQIGLLGLAGSSSDYNLLDFESFKITKLSLFDAKIVTSNYSVEVATSPLPSWIGFDRESDTLTVESKKLRDIGTYTFHSAFSLKIPRDAFKNLEKAGKPLSSNNLWAWLISLGYVDNELFLTANFGEKENFFLPDEFEDYQAQIYETLRKFYFETCTGFEIVPSLQYKEKNGTLGVSTLSTNNLKVEIKLEPKGLSDVKFLSRTYGSLLPMLKDNNKTKIALEGTLKEINTALNLVVVNFENGTSCDANIVVNDGFNPQVMWELKNISRYFKANRNPFVNSMAAKTVQEQIDSAEIQTGTYFTFPFAEDTFDDEYAAGHLDYEIIKAKDKTAFPSWLSFNGLTLKGTPPEEMFGRDIDLILIAKNEFKQERVSFTLHIRMSSVFMLKLLMRYSPYILTLIGLFVSANKIFNILKKKDYKHGKEYYINPGEEISANTIFPISFIREELKQSQLILNELISKKKMNAAEFTDSSQNRLNKEKIISAIKDTIQNMPVESKRQITLYPSPIIDQIIINKFVWMQLDLKSETQTKSVFEKLQPYCLEVIERDASSASEFAINENKLNQVMKKVKTPAAERNSNLEESLINHHDSGVNIHLLKDAILAFAFENHTINTAPLDVDIAVKQKVPANALFRLLKLDLRDVHLNDKNKIDYGINYKISNDRLIFHGIVQDYFKGKTLVVQVKNLHQRIMKEIWIHGVSNEFQKDEIFMIRDENEARGQGYEVY